MYVSSVSVEQELISEAEREALMHQLGETGAQIICATHSPLLASVPGADIIELGEHGYRRTAWGQLDLTDHWRRYLTSPDAYLRRLLEPAGTP